MTLRDLWGRLIGNASDFVTTVTNDNVLDWPISYLFSALLLAVFFSILAFVVAAILIGNARDIFTKATNKLGIFQTLAFFDRKFGVAFGGFLFFLLILVAALLLFLTAQFFLVGG